MIDMMWSELTVQEYWKGSCDHNLIFAALSTMDYDSLPVSLSVCLCVCCMYCVLDMIVMDICPSMHVA